MNRKILQQTMNKSLVDVWKRITFNPGDDLVMS